MHVEHGSTLSDMYHSFFFFAFRPQSAVHKVYPHFSKGKKGPLSKVRDNF